MMDTNKDSLGEFWDDWQRETEELEKKNKALVESIKREAMIRQGIHKEDGKNEMP